MFCNKLKELRKQFGLTQSELAKIIGVKASTVGMYEQNRRFPDVSVISKLCSYFNVSFDYLINPLEKDNLIASNDLEKIVLDFKDDLLKHEALMFKGVLLNGEDIEKVIDSMLIGAVIAANEKKQQNDEENYELPGENS